MNDKVKNLLANLNYTITANLFVLGISVFLNLVVPKFIGVTEYSYWQLYVFYSSYVGFFHFGWIDGIYLKIGGDRYENLDKRKLGTQFFYLFIFQLILGFILFCFSFYFVSNANKRIILISTAVVLVITNLKSFILFVLQSTNRIKEYAKLSVNDRYLYIVLTMIYLVLGGRNFIVLVILDIFSKVILTLWGMVVVKDIVLAKRYKFSIVSEEVLDNIRIGSNLMIGNIASMLILGISRLLVERRWNIEVFGKLSFALSISNMFMLFISATSIVLYPVLRRTDLKKLPELYMNVRNIFVPFTLILLLLFNPIRFILEWWLPNYKESLYFMGILFPMIVYEGRVTMLVNTYLKTIREEKIILLTNVVTVIFTLLLTSISVYIFNSVDLVVLSIIFSIMFRCIFAEILLTKILRINCKRLNVIEVLLVLVFIGSNVFFSPKLSLFIYLVSILFYLCLTYSKIVKSLRYFLLIMGRKKIKSI